MRVTTVSRGATALYNACVTITDELVGKLLEELERSGLDDQTTIIFTSDHGDMLGSHGCYHKSHLYDEATRVPFLISSPEYRPRRNVEQVAQLIDIMPTLLDHLGIEGDQHMDGQSLAPILRDECQSLAQNHAFIECLHGQIGIRTPQYLLGMQTDVASQDIINDNSLLIDVIHDPLQQEDRSALPVTETISRLQHQLRDWHEQTPWLENDSVEAIM